MAAGVLGEVTAHRVNRFSVAALAAAGVFTGYAFGGLMDIWDWTFFRGASGVGWVPGLPAGEALARFGRFYLLTSLAYDSFRAAGNAILVVALGAPVLAALARFRARLAFKVVAIDSAA
jgi:energy-coupling factor transport system substrate-specific component